MGQLRVTEYLDERQLEHTSYWMEKAWREIRVSLGDIGEGFVFLEKLEEFNKARAEKLNQEALAKKYDEGTESEEESAEDPQNGDGSSLYETPNGEPARTPQEWAEHYEGKSWNEISTENKGKHGD